MSSKGAVRAGLFAALILAGSAGIIAILRLGPGPAKSHAGLTPVSQPVGKEVATAPAAMPEAVFTCGACHGIPPPSALPRAKWEAVITMMQERIEAYGLTPAPTAEQVKEAIRYYTAAAPESLAALPLKLPPTPIAFNPTGFGRPPPPQGGAPPVIGHIRLVDLDKNGRLDVLACDTSTGVVLWLGQRPDGGWVEQVVGQAPSPSHVEAADLDGDGKLEIVFSYLGGLQPTDDPIGGVYQVKNDGRGTVQQLPIVQNLPRVSDVRPADLDGDGDMDLAIAMFGMYATGGVAWLEQTAPGVFQERLIERICGVSHVPIGDINGDGLPDIVALVSQHHERIIACINKGAGKFEPRVIYQAPHPLWGLSGIELVDLNKDGRLDVLFTNGDALDFDTAPKPYHGVQWLENLGGLRFRYHDVMRFYGAYRATAADLNGDGHLDLVVSSMSQPWQNQDAQSLIWLENNGKQVFSPRAIANSPTHLVSVEVGDLTGDGKPDILAGGMYVLKPYGRVGRMVMWSNQGQAR